MVKILIGNIFESKMDVLVNTVNCVGVMGKGIAKELKDKYPDMFKQYKELCDNKKINTGELYPYYKDNNIKIINFPTKQHWRSPSKIEYIIDGLKWFKTHYKELNIQSIAFPPLGCGNGGLEWEYVGPIMYHYLKDIELDIEIYAPFNTSKEYLKREFLENNYNENIKAKKGNTYKRINNKWFLALQIVKYLNASKYDIKVGRVVFQKICYVLAREGIELNLNFVKGTYGPYSKEIKEMITILANNNYIYEKQLGYNILLNVTKSFKINKALYSDKEVKIVNKVYSIFEGVRNSSQAEILTTILYSYDELKKQYETITENVLYNYIHEWKKNNENFKDENLVRDFIKTTHLEKMIKIDYSKDYVDNYF